MSNETSATRRYLAAFLPWLPAERAVLANAAPRDSVFAVTATVGGTVRIVAVAAAADAGLVGLPLADARARVPALPVVQDDPAADLALLERLADACAAFSPTVALDPPDGLLIDITGCGGEWGGETGLVAAVAGLIGRAGVTPSLHVAATPDAAAALARFDVATVDALPLAALRIDPALRQALSRTGLATIGALAAQPRAPLAARYGPAVTTLLARLLGEEDVRLVPRRSPPPIAVEHRFAEPILGLPQVRTTLDRLIVAAADQLAARDLGGRRFAAQLVRSDGHVARLALDTGAPTRDPQVVGRLFAERIETLADPLDPGFGYDLIRLAVPLTERLAAGQPDLGGAVSAEAELALLIDRLTTRLGRGRVRRLARGDSHLPERAGFDVPVAAPPATWPAASGEAPHRPLHLYTPPQPIEVIAEVPDGPPRGFRWHRLQHDVVRAEGPERIAAEWWRRHDGCGATRDYYRLEDSQGRRFWVFRHGLYGVEKANPRWYLHGVFA